MKNEKITIVLPDGREIKRKMYSRYIANNSPVWVVVNGINFYIDYPDLDNPVYGRYILSWCSQSEFTKKYSVDEYIIKGDNDFLSEGEQNILYVVNDFYDATNEYKNKIVHDFWKNVKR